MKTVYILLQTRNHAPIRECTLREYLRLNDYSASERHDLITRLRRDQLTPGNPPAPTPEMFYQISLLTD